MSEARKAFEAWLVTRWAGGRGELTIRDDGEYVNGRVEFAWASWQAATARASRIAAARGYLRGDSESALDAREISRLIASGDEPGAPIAAKLRDLVATQGAHGNWNYDGYMQGMFNGMELALAMLEDREPEFRQAPDKWLHDLPPAGKLECETERSEA